MKHTCISKLAITGSDNGLLPGRCQAIIWTNAGITLIGSLSIRNMLQWNFNQNSNIFINTLRPRQNGRQIPDDNFKCIFMDENIQILIKISLKFVPKDPINNIPALVQIMAWCWPGNKPLSEWMMVSLLTHICVNRPQWVKENALEKCHQWYDVHFLSASMD